MPNHHKEGFVPDLLFALQGRCPVCRKGSLYSSFLQITEKCESCDAPLAEHDIGDGAAVLMIFVLGFSVIPLAWVFDLWLQPPIWAHALFVTIMASIMVFFLLPMAKSYIIMLEYRHRPQEEWDKNDENKQDSKKS